MLLAAASVASRRTAASLAPALGAIWSRGMAGLWSHVEMAPRDPILGVTEMWKADTNPEKINLGVGAYRNDDGQPVVLDSVRLAEQKIAGKEFMEYLPIGGYGPFVQESIKLAYGAGSEPIQSGRVAAVQALSGTGGCRLMGEFLVRYAPGTKLFVPETTWSNHWNIFKDAHLETGKYRYYDAATRGLNFAGLVEDLKAMPKGSFVLLHACAHNPTGVDPTESQWREISSLMKERGLFAFFDMAYQGFASGDFDRDATSLHIFAEHGHNFALAQSFAKNMGLYGQRTGCFSIMCADEDERARVDSQIRAVARAMYSNPPLHGALLVSTILSDPRLNSMWRREVKEMADRIHEMRTELKQGLIAAGSKLNWDHITNQIGMFAFTGMTPEQVDALKDRSIYLTRNGRISMAGVNTKNVQRLAEAMHEVTK
ncbi:unnamed protein product [Pedinophyceae sp. YPF-701]|nr:unnamed protein product [Pedinophyceae sp. YPF-701]